MKNLNHQLREIHRSSYIWSLSCCNYNEEMAKDVLQAAYLKVCEGKAKFTGKSILKTWFFSIVRRTAKDQFRKIKKNVENLDFIPDIPDKRSNGQENLENEQLIKEILNRISKMQREVLTLVFYGDLTIQEAAAVLNISVGAARSHYERAKSNFRKWLNIYKIDKSILYEF